MKQKASLFSRKCIRMVKKIAGVFLTGILFSYILFAQEKPLLTKLDENEVLCNNFMGFGVEWDTPGYLENNVTDNDFEIIKKRVEWMRFPVVRIMIQAKWCYKGNGEYDWESKEMKLLYRNLDLCERQGITVFLTDWGCEPAWLKCPEVSTVDEKLYAEIIGNYMAWLKNEKGYSCIRYFIFGNEPNLEVKDWKRWKAGLLNVYDELKEHGLHDKVILSGSDHSDGDEWHKMAVDQLQNILGAYDFHYYHRANSKKRVNIYDYFKNSWQYVSDSDPKSKNKPRVIAEAGIIKVNDGYTASHNSLSDTPNYGIIMADYAIKAIEAGSWSVIAWMLDDNSHYNFDNGMWKNKASEFALKPWFYSWALLCRYFRPDQNILKADVEGETTGIRCLAACGKDEKKGVKRWTICIVNPSDSIQTVRLRVDKLKQIKMQKYIIDLSQPKTNSDGFPQPVQIKNYDLKSGIDISCSGNSLLMLTSQID